MRKIKYRTILKHLLFIFLAGVTAFLLVLFLGNFLFDKINPATDTVFGVSYSPQHAQELGLDPKQTFTKMLDELKIHRLRLPTYWTSLEPTPNQFNFNETDFYINQASKHPVKILLVVGFKQPGWPECRAPEWILNLPLAKRQEQLLKLMTHVVNRYKDNNAIWGYQVENEPLFRFGLNCDAPDREFLAQEVRLVKKIDPKKPIVITDSGELRPWRTPMRLSDVFGTTIYRTVYDRLFGYLHWPIPPAFYYFKSTLARTVFAHNNQRTIISELQAEPWSPGSLAQTPISTQIEVFPIKDLISNIDFGKKTGFSEIYLWGTEWWYFMAAHNHPEYLEAVKLLFH